MCGPVDDSCSVKRVGKIDRSAPARYTGTQFEGVPSLWSHSRKAVGGDKIATAVSAWLPLSCRVREDPPRGSKGPQSSHGGGSRRLRAAYAGPPSPSSPGNAPLTWPRMTAHLSAKLMTCAKTALSLGRVRSALPYLANYRFAFTLRPPPRLDNHNKHTAGQPPTYRIVQRLCLLCPSGHERWQAIQQNRRKPASGVSRNVEAGGCGGYGWREAER